MIRILNYINGTCRDKLVLSADNLHAIKRYVDAYFDLCPYFRSHVGDVVTLGGGTILSFSHNQNMNTLIITEDELFGADNASTMCF